MLPENRAVFGVYRSKGEADLGVSALRNAGFNPSDLTVLSPQHTGLKDFQRRQRTQIQMGAMIGAAAGMFIFGITSVLIGMEAIPLPGGNDITAGEFVSVVIAGIVGGIFLGAAIGALVGIGTPEKAGKRYAKYIESGGVLLSVHIHDAQGADKAKHVMADTHAQDITILNKDEGWKKVYSDLDAAA